MSARRKQGAPTIAANARFRANILLSDAAAAAGAIPLGQRGRSTSPAARGPCNDADSKRHQASGRRARNHGSLDGWRKARVGINAQTDHEQRLPSIDLRAMPAPYTARRSAKMTCFVA